MHFEKKIDNSSNETPTNDELSKWKPSINKSRLPTTNKITTQIDVNVKTSNENINDEEHCNIGEYARRLRQLIDSGDENIHQRLFIDLNPERRCARLKFDDTIFKATLYDLPSIIETYKTFYRKFYIK
ncbi:unnamed protein product [Rotaria sordida]|nr:unnamed protein product [Rotaria sordida]